MNGIRTNSSVDRAMASGAMCAGSTPVWCIFLFKGESRNDGIRNKAK